MKYTREEVLEYVREEDVKFIRLAFCDVFGTQKNVSVMPDELPRAFEYGIAFDASEIRGFGDGAKSDLLLFPEPDTLVPLPWRPEHGRVMQMFSRIAYPDGSPFECDTRYLLKKAVGEAARSGFAFTFGAEMEFYLFLLDEAGRPTKIPCDEGGYMDVAPLDRGENVRREICLTLEKMGIRPEKSHHEAGPGQNEIAFRFSDPVSAADDAQLFKRVAQAVAARSGLYADFSPKPLEGQPGSGFHINIAPSPFDGRAFDGMVKGILARSREISAFLAPAEGSYRRLGRLKAPSAAVMAEQDRSALVRIPAARGEYRRAEVRSADGGANPYLAFMLLMRSGMEGIEGPAAGAKEAAPGCGGAQAGCGPLPESRADACRAAEESAFTAKHVPRNILSAYCACDAD